MNYLNARKSIYGLLTTGLGVALLLGSALVPDSSEARNGAGRVNRRQSAENHRIREGRKEGDFSKREAHDLRTDRRKIRRIERRAFKNDGKIGPKEAARLERKQNQLSGKIYKYRHNEESRDNPSGAVDVPAAASTVGGTTDTASAPNVETAPTQ